jgi:beta-galactosidase
MTSASFASTSVTRREFLGSAAAGSFAAAPGPSGTVPAKAILAKPRVGAEFFLNRTETHESIDRHFARMAETGLTIARIFTLWDQVEHKQGVWDFTRYDWIYNAAERNGILIANTLCSEDPPGWMGGAPFYHAWRDLSNPRLRPYSEIYLEKVITHYKNHPAHGVWLLQNEPGIKENGDEPYVLAAYTRWLEQKYGTVENLNKIWYLQLRSFSDARRPETSKQAGWADYAPNLDWLRFRCDHLTNQLRWLHSQVDKYDPGALTHCNPPGLTSNMPASGRDMWQIKRTVAFLGASMHASWHFGMFPRQDFGVAYGFCCDLVRSASAPAPWWVTELQAGPTVLTGARPLDPTSGEITRWLWDGFGNGSRGIVFWLWHPRTEGNEAGEWGLAGPAGQPTERTRAVNAVARVMAKHDSFFREAKPYPARAAILYDRDAMLLYAVDGWRRPVDEITRSLMGCYKALSRAHVPVDFLDTSQLNAGEARRYKVLYLPYAYALSARSVSAIRDFVNKGGTLWADGLVAWKDEKGKTLQFPPGQLTDVFGCRVDDIQAAWEPFSFHSETDRAGDLWRCVLSLAGGTVLVNAPDGSPAAVTNRFGAGRALYYGTALTFGFLHREDSQVCDWIAKPGVEASRDIPVRLLNAPGNVIFRAMQSPEGNGAVFNNWGPAARATVQFPVSITTVTNALTGASVPVERGVSTVELEGGASAVLIAR